MSVMVSCWQGFKVGGIGGIMEVSLIWFVVGV